jgi:hypothetical protein
MPELALIGVIALSSNASSRFCFEKTSEPGITPALLNSTSIDP